MKASKIGANHTFGLGKSFQIVLVRGLNKSSFLSKRRDAILSSGLPSQLSFSITFYKILTSSLYFFPHISQLTLNTYSVTLLNLLIFPQPQNVLLSDYLLENYKIQDSGSPRWCFIIHSSNILCEFLKK